MAVSKQTFAAIRFGFGLHPAQEPPRDPSDLLDSLDAAARHPITPRPLSRNWRHDAVQRVFQMRRAKGAEEKRRALNKQVYHAIAKDMAGLILHRSISPYGFYERLVSFWLDHFSLALRGAIRLPLLPDFEISAMRPHITGDFASLAIAATQHPAMLIYLDQHASAGPNSPAAKRRGIGLNENLGRELLELHTIGVDAPYTQADVRATALLLTGYGILYRTGAFKFRHQMAEPGAQTVLGQHYGGATASPTHAEALIRDLAVHPATAHHLASKLVRHFVSDTPDPAHVRHVEAAWRRSGGNLPDVYAALVEHPAGWEEFGQKIKRPLDLVVSTLRAAGMDEQMVRRMNDKAKKRVLGAVRRLGQPPARVPSPAGWPEEAAAWITPQGLAQRITYAKRAAQLIEKRGADPRAFAESALGDALGADTAFAVSAAPERWQGIALVLASPEFNRR